jgi:hypothetical protein
VTKIPFFGIPKSDKPQNGDNNAYWAIAGYKLSAGNRWLFLPVTPCRSHWITYARPLFH